MASTAKWKRNTLEAESLKYVFQRMKALVVRLLREEESYHLPDSKHLNVKQAELTFRFQIGFLEGKTVKMICLADQNQFPWFIYSLNIQTTGYFERIMRWVFILAGKENKQRAILHFVCARRIKPSFLVNATLLFLWLLLVICAVGRYKNWKNAWYSWALCILKKDTEWVPGTSELKACL